MGPCNTIQQFNSVLCLMTVWALLMALHINHCVLTLICSILFMSCYSGCQCCSQCNYPPSDFSESQRTGLSLLPNSYPSCIYGEVIFIFSKKNLLSIYLLRTKFLFHFRGLLWSLLICIGSRRYVLWLYAFQLVFLSSKWMFWVPLCCLCLCCLCTSFKSIDKAGCRGSWRGATAGWRRAPA